MYIQNCSLKLEKSVSKAPFSWRSKVNTAPAMQIEDPVNHWHVTWRWVFSEYYFADKIRCEGMGPETKSCYGDSLDHRFKKNLQSDHLCVVPNEPPVLVVFCALMHSLLWGHQRESERKMRCWCRGASQQTSCTSMARTNLEAFKFTALPQFVDSLLSHKLFPLSYSLKIVTVWVVNKNKRWNIKAPLCSNDPTKVAIRNDYGRFVIPPSHRWRCCMYNQICILTVVALKILLQGWAEYISKQIKYIVITLMAGACVEHVSACSSTCATQAPCWGIYNFFTPSFIGSLYSRPITLIIIYYLKTTASLMTYFNTTPKPLRSNF